MRRFEHRGAIYLDLVVDVGALLERLQVVVEEVEAVVEFVHLMHTAISQRMLSELNLARLHTGWWPKCGGAVRLANKGQSKIPRR